MTAKLKSKMTCKKQTLIIFNLLFLITGICLIATGAFLTVYSFHYFGHETTYNNFYDGRFIPLVDMLYIIGCIMAIVSLFGFLGAYRERIFLLLIFVVSLTTIFVIEVTIVATGYAMKEQVKEKITNTMFTMMHEYGTNAAARRTIDSIQETFGCCGVLCCQDWDEDLPVFNMFLPKERTGLWVPQHYMTFRECRMNTTDGLVIDIRLPNSCCGKYNEYGECVAMSEQSCVSKLEPQIWTYGIGTACVVTLIQVIGLVLACMLVKAVLLKKNKLGMKYSKLQGGGLIKNDSH